MENQKEKLDVLMIELNGSMKQIEAVHRLVISLVDSDLQEHYAKQSQPTLQRFEQLSKEIKAVLENQFEYEYENKIPPNLQLRSLYRNLFGEGFL